MIRKLILILMASFVAAPVLAVDILSLWDFSNPALSEQRFRSALGTANGDEVLILQTQIARTYVFRKDFQKSRQILRSIEPQIRSAGAEAQVRYWLELGRTYASHQHPPESQTPESKSNARMAVEKALTISREARLDGLAIDAIHMLAFVDTDPADQVKWGQQALSLVEASNQPEAKQWEASVRSNLGEALYDLGRYEEALGHFRRAVILREQGANPRATRDANWHVARALRMQKHFDQAFAIQLRLERESEAMSDPRHYIFEELALLYQANGCQERARHYLARAKELAD
ncbi:tetratricopeptide repeat protein [Lysobacter koreensis]|uniref:Tetratricopeptide repeat protein n=1 Tax=Lysobacter koreensis TaxID=266122 RepID=A0ABW2YPV7_9GAMM